jgi:exonuclease III
MNITSFNVNGISTEKKKRLSIFAKCKELNSITLLQETHSKSMDENIWKKEWGGNILFSHGSSNSKGVCIMIPQNLDHHIEDKITDENGRILIIKIKVNNELFVVCNLYAPTRDHKAEQNKFIKEVKNLLNNYEHHNIIIGGDFNIYFNPKLDKLDTMPNKNDNPVYRNEILSMIESMDINDAWRTLFPNTRRYTWHARGRSSRLDYFLISNHLLNNLITYKILPGIHSDHSILFMKFEFDFNSRGRGYWKFNAELLHDTDYVNNIKQIIKESEAECSNYLDKGLSWEIVKLKIRSFSVPYCIKKKKNVQNLKKA